MEVRAAPAPWERPIPAGDAGGREFWAAAAEGRLLIQQCGACAHLQFYPRQLCTRCGGTPEWRQASGRGTVYTFTVIRQNGARPFSGELPYIVAVIELEEGPRMLGNVTGCSPEEIAIGLPVAAYAVLAAEKIGIPFWEPRDHPGSAASTRRSRDTPAS
jgi:uncharacterized protein